MNHMEPKDIALIAAKTLDEKKALDIMLLDVGLMTVLTDYMIICSGRAATQVKALTDAVEEKLSALGVEPRRKDGTSEGRWSVLDYGTVMIHVFHEQERAYYQLERLWADGTNAVPFEKIEE